MVGSDDPLAERDSEFGVRVKSMLDVRDGDTVSTVMVRSPLNECDCDLDKDSETDRE
jgi:hypothetical protein